MKSILTGLTILLLTTVSAFAADELTDPAGAVGAEGLALGIPDCDRLGVCGVTTGLKNGEAYAGNGLVWSTNFTDQVLELLDTNANCAVVQTCPAPGASAPSENAFDGQYLYHYDFGTGLLYQIDPVTCAVVSTCDPPGDDLAEGLAWDGTHLWKGDSTTLYRFSPPPSCEVVFSCPNPGGDSADGLAVCGDFLVMLGYSGTIYQIDRDDCTLIGACALNAGPAGNGLASDQLSTLWVDNGSESLDVLDQPCDVPVSVGESTWGQIKGGHR